MAPSVSYYSVLAHRVTRILHTVLLVPPYFSPLELVSTYAHLARTQTHNIIKLKVDHIAGRSRPTCNFGLSVWFLHMYFFIC